MPKRILITSALLYANGPLHFGHLAGAYLPGDCYARFQRLQGADVHFISGSDEYGIAITLSAEIAGRSPREHVDHWHQVNIGLFDKLNFNFDFYGRTTWEGHQESTCQFFQDLLKNGYIEEKVTEQLYCEATDRFLADRYVKGICPRCKWEEARGDECPNCGASFEATDLGNPRSKLDDSPLTKRPSRHWFICFDRFKGQLSEWLEKKSWRPHVLNFVKHYVDDLRPRAITRDSKWGIPVPLKEADGKVFYVWFDAPIGYISVSKQWALEKGQPEAWKDYWCDSETQLVHFIGKDNISFHAVFFPAMVMGQDQPIKLVDELPANEYLMLEGRQFSKSDGWYIDLESFLDTYGSDSLRYTLAANAPENSDSEFTFKDFQQRCNGELLGKYGNLVNRVLVFLRNNCGGKVPEKVSLDEASKTFLKESREIVDGIAKSFDGFHLRQASQGIMELARHGNTYFNDREPWKAVKDESRAEELSQTLLCCLDCLKLLAICASPIIPQASQKLWELLAFTGKVEEENWDTVLEKALPYGLELPKPEVLFTRIEDAQMNQEREKLQAMAKKQEGAKKAKASPQKDAISFQDFERLDLRVGLVKEAKEVPKSKKLFHLAVDTGDRVRSVVSGIRQHYQAEELIGRRVVVVTNLKPVKIMGIQSEGMVLAGSHDDGLKLVEIGELPPGTSIS